MSGEIEAVGAAATAGLVAGAIEGREAHKAGDGVCANCGAALTSRYCADCGQPAHVHRTLGHLFEELLHGLFHFDTKAWRTLPMLITRPGTLTRAYIDGKRTRYVSPLTLFLLTVFFMFAVFSFTGGPNMLEVRTFSTNDAQPGVVTNRHLATGGEGAHVLANMLAQQVRDGDIVMQTGDPARDAKIRERLQNPDLLLYKVEQASYKFAFLLIPLTLPFLALLFIGRRGVTFYDHAVFALYSLSFVSLVFVLVSTFAPWSRQNIISRVALDSVLLFAVPAHMFFQLKGGYGLGVWSALWRTVLLIVICLLVLAVFLALIAAVALLG